MLTEKIKTLISELHQECEKQGVTLSLCAFDDEGKANNAYVGSEMKIRIAIIEQKKKLETHVYLSMEEEDTECQ